MNQSHVVELRAEGDVAFLAWPQSILDELDYGILLFGPDQHLVLMNRSAEDELDAEHPLQLRQRQLRATLPADAARLQIAMQEASLRGLRTMLALGEGSQRVSLSVVPLGEDGGGLPRATMVILGKRRVCEQLSVQCFARAHGLTQAETRVLEGLCAGRLPREIAAAQGVGLATVRTQIGAMRIKVGAASIRELVAFVARLPPIRKRLLIH